MTKFVTSVLLNNHAHVLVKLWSLYHTSAGHILIIAITFFIWISNLMKSNEKIQDIWTCWMKTIYFENYVFLNITKCIIKPVMSLHSPLVLVKINCTSCMITIICLFFMLYICLWACMTRTLVSSIPFQKWYLKKDILSAYQDCVYNSNGLPYLFIRDFLKMDEGTGWSTERGKWKEQGLRQFDVGKWTSQQNDQKKCNSINDTITVQLYRISNKRCTGTCDRNRCAPNRVYHLSQGTSCCWLCTSVLL